MNKCKACGFDVDVEGKELCFYCYATRNIGSSKLVLFNAMIENGNKFVTVQEALILNNEYRDQIGKPHTTYNAVYKILSRYSKYYDDAKKRRSGYLLLKQKTSYNKLNPGHSKTRKTGASNQPMYRYKLSARLEKRVGRYNKRWKMGFPIRIANRKNKAVILKQEEKQKARAISRKIAANEYDLFEYLLC
jgi:hypothetical protein